MNIKYTCNFYFSGNIYEITGVTLLPKNLLARRLGCGGSIIGLKYDPIISDSICSKCGSISSVKYDIINISWTFDELCEPTILKKTNNIQGYFYNDPNDHKCSVIDCFNLPELI